MVKALLFDVFGTVVDWRSSISAELRAMFESKGEVHDWDSLADGWRALYDPAMKRIRDGEREYVILDQLHRENLEQLLKTHELNGTSEAELQHLNQAWHRLTPWPDSPPGLKALRQTHIIATCSNGNIALLVNMARAADLPWDAILGAEITHSYKPSAETYLGSAKALGLDPADCMMVAAHNSDLHSAQALGLQTAYVCRPTEHGPDQATDLTPTGDWTYVATSLLDLARQLNSR